MSYTLYMRRLEHAMMITRSDLPDWCIIQVMPGVFLGAKMLGTDWAIDLLKDADGKHLQFWESDHAAWMAIEVYARA